MTTLDKIIRSFLLGRQLSIHYYLQTLLFARDCLRELHFDDLKCVQYLSIAPDAFNELKLPCGILDVVSVGFPTGQKLRPLVRDDGMNSLVNYDDNGVRQRFTDTPTVNNIVTSANGWAFNSFDDYGTYIGRDFGYRPEYVDTYKYIKERNVVKVNEDLCFDKAVVQCIGDGTDCNSATQVDPYAIATITAYIEWYMDEKGKCGGAGEAKFNRARQTLRGRKSDITLDGIKRAIQNSYSK
jgi:hypothetical protein